MMRRVALTLAALAVVGFGAGQAMAAGGPSHPMAAHVAASHAVQTVAHPSPVVYQEVRHPGRSYGRYYPAPHGRYVPRGYYRPGVVVVRPPVWGPPAVVVPHHGYHGYHGYPGYYRGPQPYHSGQGSFSIYGPNGGISIGW